MMRMASCIILFALVLGAHELFARLPDREEIGPRVTAISFEPVALPRAGFAPLRLAGAWSLRSGDPRFGGISAMVSEGAALVALTDSAAIVRFPKPGGGAAKVHIDEVPAGPGSRRFKPNRDTEGLASDPGGRGWWVAFEFNNQLWLYGRDFDRALLRVEVPSAGLGPNKGIEGLTSVGGALVAAPEGGGLLRFGDRGWNEIPLSGKRRTSEVAALDSRTLIVVHRTLTPLGMRNTLAALQLESGGARLLWRKHLPLARFDNVEGLAVERRKGGYRLWLISDNGFNPRLRTLLIALDIDASVSR